MDDREAIHRMKNGEIGGLEALVNPVTCQVVPLPDLNGEIRGWVQSCCYLDCSTVRFFGLLRFNLCRRIIKKTRSIKETG